MCRSTTRRWAATRWLAARLGAGKTRTYEVISTQVIHNLKDVLIIVDPKNDDEWKKRVEKECARAGRKFLLLQSGEAPRVDPA